jgi:hypothetical protein
MFIMFPHLVESAEWSSTYDEAYSRYFLRAAAQLVLEPAMQFRNVSVCRLYISTYPAKLDIDNPGGD